MDDEGYTAVVYSSEGVAGAVGLYSLYKSRKVLALDQELSEQIVTLELAYAVKLYCAAISLVGAKR